MIINNHKVEMYEIAWLQWVNCPSRNASTSSFQKDALSYLLRDIYYSIGRSLTLTINSNASHLRFIAVSLMFVNDKASIF
jgi:hypothetical protein